MCLVGHKCGVHCNTLYMWWAGLVSWECSPISVFVHTLLAFGDFVGIWVVLIPLAPHALSSSK